MVKLPQKWRSTKDRSSAVKSLVSFAGLTTAHLDADRFIVGTGRIGQARNLKLYWR